MEILGFVAGALVGAGQHWLAKRALSGKSKQGIGAFYIAQRLILSLGFLTLVFFVDRNALLYAAIGLVAAGTALALIFRPKG